jgi:ATP-dependent Clp protease ATP-binding subunit ClpC
MISFFYRRNSHSLLALVGPLDSIHILKPALARGEIQCIGATTLDEYRQYIEKDGALERRFQKIIVEPTLLKKRLQQTTSKTNRRPP